MKKPVYDLLEWHRKIGFDEAKSPGCPPALGDILLTARIPSTDLDLRRTLSESGFHFMELTLHPHLDLQAVGGAYQIGCTMRTISQNELDFVLQEAQTSFQYSRFFRDPMVAAERAAMRFHNWVRNSIKDPNKQVLLFKSSSGEPLGFFVERGTEGERFLELTAMFPQARGRGLARVVWETYLRTRYEDGVISLKTNISAENSAVVGLYPRLGFVFKNPSVVFHCHLQSQP